MAPETPGGWPVGPLESSWEVDRRDAANAVADIRAALLEALTPIVAWLARKLAR